MGTLGAGNHYAEVQVVDKVFDRAAARKMGIDREGQVRAGRSACLPPLPPLLPEPGQMRHRQHAEASARMRILTLYTRERKPVVVQGRQGILC
jgi:hypothetical protein